MKTGAERIRGLQTGWIEAGDSASPLLLFLHGFPDTPEVWRHQLEYFQQRYHVVCPYVRGAELSDESPNVERYGRDAVSLDLLQLLAHFDPTRERPVIIVGHDLGAVHAWHLAGFLGARVRALVIMNGMSLEQMRRRLHRSPAQLAKSWYIFAMQVPWIPDLIARRMGAKFARWAYNRGMLPRAAQPPAEARAVIGPLNQYRAFFRELPRAMMEREPRLQCPVLVLWGERDAFLQTPEADEFSPFAARVTIRLLNGCHWIQREKPDEVNRWLDHFFEENRSAAR